MYEQLDKLTAAVSNSSNEDAQKAGTTGQSLKSSINFMNTLNEMFSYIQLPVRLNGQNIHSELYVMKNKNKKTKVEKDSLSVLLHLDMEHLKPLDVKITLKNNNVDANFYMSDKSAKELIETNMEYLSANLMEKGFEFNGKVHEQTKDTDIVENFLNTHTDDAPIRRYSFDIRT